MFSSRDFPTFPMKGPSLGLCGKIVLEMFNEKSWQVSSEKPKGHTWRVFKDFLWKYMVSVCYENLFAKPHINTRPRFSQTFYESIFLIGPRATYQQTLSLSLSVCVLWRPSLNFLYLFILYEFFIRRLYPDFIWAELL